MTAISLIVEFDSRPAVMEDYAGVDGVALRSKAAVEADWPDTGLVVLRNLSPGTEEAWRDREGVIWSGDDLQTVARSRDEWKDLVWVPRLTVDKAQVGYHFHRAFPGEGFSVYQPDTAAVGGYRIGGRELREVLKQAADLGFDRLWLHGRDADLAGRGLDLNLLERAQRWFDGDLWLSGGASEPGHLANLAREGGAAAVIVPDTLVAKESVEPLRTALAPPPPPEVPIHFAGRGGDGNASVG